MRFKSVVIVFWILTFPFVGYSSIKQEVAKTIVRVKSGNKYSTGFFWQNGTQIITTLHSIANPNNIEIYIPSISGWKTAQVKRTLKNGDLVLLETSAFTSPHFIAKYHPKNPAIDTKVFAVGYNAGNTKYQDRDFYIGLLEGNYQLKDLLPVSAKAEVQKLGFPSLNTPIAYLKGQLLHGFSGSPVVDFEGKLVGIADGGLENGAAGISWCISAHSINQLAASTESFPNLNYENVEVLFSAEGYASNEIIDVGTYQVQKVKTRTFAQLDETGSYSTYPEMGLYQLLMAYELLGIDYNNFRYDIYLEHTTGATIVVPESLPLQGSNGELYARSADQRNAINIYMAETHNLNQTALQFEQALMDITGIYSWIFDPRYSFAEPLIRPDNVIINRKAYYNFNPNGYLFEVLAGKGNTFLGVFLIMDNSINPNTLMFYYPTEVAQFALAAHLTTFSY